MSAISAFRSTTWGDRPALIVVKNGEARFEVIDRATDGTILAKNGIEVRGILLLRGELVGLACVLHSGSATVRPYFEI